MSPSRGVALTPDLLQGLFEAVDNSLAPASRPLDLLAVGGTAMLLRWYPGRVTYDVDLVTPLPAPVKDAVAAAAAPYPGLNPFWLNDGPPTARPPTALMSSRSRTACSTCAVWNPNSAGDSF